MRIFFHAYLLSKIPNSEPDPYQIVQDPPHCVQPYDFEFYMVTCLSPRWPICRRYLSVCHVSLTTWVNISLLSFGPSRVSHHVGQYVVVIFRSVTCLSPRGPICCPYLSVCHVSLSTWVNKSSLSFGLSRVSHHVVQYVGVSTPPPPPPTGWPSCYRRSWRRTTMSCCTSRPGSCSSQSSRPSSTRSSCPSSSARDS